MRTIKFRAWHKETRQMLPDVSTGTIKIFDEGRSYLANDCDFMQFTGLTDKNGKEIYEGDIVKYSRLTSERDEHNLIGKIEYEQDRYGISEWFENKFGEKDFRKCIDELEMAVINDCCEVIGNIYENPELINN
jgi:uncharacterized phage protein (TIGR01671 family)